MAFGIGDGALQWRRDGRRRALFCVALDGRPMAAAVNSRESQFGVGAVRPLFQTRIRDQFHGVPYYVTADGHRFLMNDAHRANTNLVDHPRPQRAGLSREMSRWEQVERLYHDALARAGIEV